MNHDGVFSTSKFCTESGSKVFKFYEFSLKIMQNFVKIGQLFPKLAVVVTKTQE